MRKEFVVMRIDAAPGTTSIKLDMHEYKQLGLSVGDKVNLDISKSETLGV